MSEFNISLGNSSQRVVQKDSGTNVTLKSTATTSVTRLSDVNLTGLTDGSVLVYDAATESFKVKQFLAVNEDGVITFEGGGDF